METLSRPSRCPAGRRPPAPASHGGKSLTKKCGIASADEACAIGLEAGAREYRFVRRYLERNPQLPLNLRQVDPLIRQLTLYRDLIEKRTGMEKQT